MLNYKNERKFWLDKLKESGIKAPASMYPLVGDDYQEDQIDRMKMHLTQLAEMQKYQKQEAAAE